ncbi:MAG: carbonic anhydrase [Dehalococcoidia bacterium]|nr:carbonic anhydrase [Dehalococcoidia bacterium]
MTMVGALLEANARFAETFDASGIHAPRFALLTCMDGRLDPARFLDLAPGDAHVIRNAGGRADADAIRSIVVSYRLLGTREIVVVHHEDCGMMRFTNDELRDMLRADLGLDASQIDFLPFSDLDESVRVDVRMLRQCPLIPDAIPISGFVYDVSSGRLREVR